MKQLFSETIKLKDGALYNLPYHQMRLERTLSHFGGKKIDITAALHSIPDQAQQGLFKCRVVYNSNNITNIEFVPYTLRHIKTVGVVRCNDIEYSHKSTNRGQLDELLAQSGCDDIIIIKNGLVTDASAANLVFESPQGLFTPETYLLPGTKRQYLLDAETIRQRKITIADIQHYNRIRFINAMVDLEDNIGIAPTQDALSFCI